MAPKLKFAQGEKVLCFHGPLMYEAKCLKTTINKDQQANYLIHYAGWNKNWDEWVPESRMFKYNSANIQKQKEVLKAHSAQFTKSKKTSAKARKPEAASGSQTPSTLLESPASATPSGLPHDESPASTTSSALPHESPASTTTSALPRNESPASTTPSAVPQNESPAFTPTGNEVVKWPAPIVISSIYSYAQESTSCYTHPSANGCTQPSTSSCTQKSTSSEASRKRRSRLDHSAESEAQYEAKLKVRITIPDELKVWLVDDWDVIMRQQKLVNLPAKVNVDDVLENYCNQKRSVRTHTHAKDSILCELTDGIKEYFNVALGCQLLYKFERPQYKELMGNHPGTPMSQLYGAIHLIRLFVKMGQMLPYMSMDEKALRQVLSLIHDFMQYVALNRASLLSLRDYMNAAPEYHRSLI